MSKKQRWVVGVHACREALRCYPQAITGIFFEDESMAQANEWKQLAKGLSVRSQVRKKSFFTQLSQFGHQGVAVSLQEEPEWPEESSSLLLFLDQVADPHNLGAVLRTSWLMEVEGVAITEHSSVKLNPTVAKVASGGAEHVPVGKVHFGNELKALKERGYWVYGFAHTGQSTLYDVEFPEKSVFIFGNEEKGVRSSVLGACDEVLRIPQVDASASYNISVSVAVACAEYRRQTKWSHKRGQS